MFLLSLATAKRVSELQATVYIIKLVPVAMMLLCPIRQNLLPRLSQRNSLPSSFFFLVKSHSDCASDLE